MGTLTFLGRRMLANMLACAVCFQLGVPARAFLCTGRAARPRQLLGAVGGTCMLDCGSRRVRAAHGTWYGTRFLQLQANGPGEGGQDSPGIRERTRGWLARKLGTSSTDRETDEEQTAASEFTKKYGRPPPDGVDYGDSSRQKSKVARRRLSGYSSTLNRGSTKTLFPGGGTVQRMFLRTTGSLVTRLNIGTVIRVALPSVAAAIFGYAYFDNISLFLYNNWLTAGEIQFLSSDEVQFIPSFLQVLGLLFSILAGNAYSVLYQQQETIYFALFQEVSEAKSLLEQTALICQGRPFYPSVLRQIKLYIRNDLRRLDIAPVELIAQTPRNDPLEKIMFMTSVGVPSVIYETVKNLRQARGHRLGACQRKFPRLGIWLLYILALLELAAFPLLGAGTVAGLGVKMDPSRVFGLQSLLFAGLAGATILVLRIIEELWQSSGGSFNVDATLARMVAGLESELEERSKGIQSVDQKSQLEYEMGADEAVPRDWS